jgi:serine/threonine-protein kinase
MLFEMLTGQAPFAGENVNAIMYQTLNSVPPPPSTLSPNVPEMLNFIVAKALAKKLDHRYQDAKEFASDLYACRDRLPRPTLPQDIVKPQVTASAPRPATPPVSKHIDTSEDESKPVATLGLSSAFDSAAATMRLAALTGSSEDVAELSRTFKMPIPSMDEINKAGAAAGGAATPVAKPKIEPPVFSQPKTVKLPVVNPSRDAENSNADKGKMLLIVVGVVILLLGFLGLFLFLK